MIVGIDLGTTNSLVSAWTDEGVVLVPNEFGEYLTPSVVSFDGKDAIVGKIAKERLVTHPEVTACEFKRHMGRATTYKLGKGGFLSPVDLSAIVLKKLIADAEKFFGQKVDSAIISVPAYFDDHQREATRLAGIKAGVKVTQLVNEPSAAALSYHFENMEYDEKFIVFDFGGGTLDVTVVDAFANMVEICNISGDNSLGGKDFNEAIALDICDKFGFDWDKLDKKEKAILVNYGETIKIRLSEEDEVKTAIIFNGNSYEYELSQQRFIDISASVFRRLTIVLKRLMNDSGLTPDDVDGVVMVGGSSKMPSVRAYMESLFPGKIMVDPKGDVAICRGVGIVTGISQREDGVKDIIMTDICPFSLGVGIVGDEMSVIIPKNQILPASRKQRYHTVENMQKAIKFEIYQGEKLTASSNLKLDTIEIPVPPKRRGEAYVDVRFSYDLNGIFDIDIYCPLNGVEVHRSRGASSGLVEGELDDIRLKMEELKQDPREIPEIKFLIEKALRLYEEGNPMQRDYLAKELDAFNKFIDEASVPDAKKAAMTFSLRLNRVEESMFAFDVEQGNLWKEFLEENLEGKEFDKSSEYDDEEDNDSERR
ncbi:Hsp70 family protein [Butyrivibrio proteoclasticus]|uniref:Hsp70 family protein n=1 Tax=Butyrivibrio proteoclasticus TaxID=43305 RepID=UPI0006856E9B|nr:Hsp70 family protein [Butyrivibrio proteoclasticus]